MAKPTDNQIKKILLQLDNCPLTAYAISKSTGITEQTILNYRNKKTFPTIANAKLLEYFFMEQSGFFSLKNSKNHVSGNNNIIGDHSNIDMRSFNSDSPDFLRAQVDLLNERIKEKDALIEHLFQIIDNLSSGQVSDAK